MFIAAEILGQSQTSFAPVVRCIGADRERCRCVTDRHLAIHRPKGMSRNRRESLKSVVRRLDDPCGERWAMACQVVLIQY
jgi:hypothetical protein